jgi:hypothetical protein
MEIDGQNTLNDKNPYTISTDFPQGNYNPARNFYSPIEIPVVGTWFNSYPQVAGTNQYEIVKQDIPNGWTWEGGGTIDPKFGGLISENLDVGDVLGWPASALPSPDKMVWRFYVDSNDDYWGYSYDFEHYLRNWYIVHSDSASPLMARQDFQIDTNKIRDIDEIRSAKLSISYRYPNGDTSGLGRVGVAYFVPTDNKYEYTRENPTDNTINRRLWPGLQYYGYQLTQTGSVDTYKNWQHQSFDVTWNVRKAYQNYLDNGANDPNWLKMEVAFSCVGNSYMYFDDVVLEIDYYNEVNEEFRLKDLFKYIEEQNKVDGNAYNFLDSIEFDPVKMAAFIESDLGLNPSGDQSGSHFNNYFHATDTSWNRIITLMQDPAFINRIEAGEALNFFDLLNYTRYVIDDDPTNNVPTPYGPRRELRSDGWVIEDPYAASRAIATALKNDLFVNSYGLINQALKMYGKELWFMFENMGIDLPWVIVYLFMNGWSKDDIYDLFEALGFLREVKENYYGTVFARSQGYIKESVTVYARVVFTSFPWTSADLFPGGVPLDIYCEMTDPIADPVLKLHQYLNSVGTRVIINTAGNINPPTQIVLESEFEGSGTFVIFPLTVRGDFREEIVMNTYEVLMYVYNNPGSRIAPPWPGVQNPYLERTTSYGFNDAGARMVNNLLRQKVMFNDAPFMEMAGDIMGLMSFLDQYMFTASTINYGGYTVLNDYSSYTLFNYLDVSSDDFIDVITGYDQLTNTFDPNGNGKADDWRAPIGATSKYRWYVRNNAPTDINGYPLRGWGTDVKGDRIFWMPVNPSYPYDPIPSPGAGAPYQAYNGKIIWSDSAQFLDDAFTSAGGKITDPANQNFNAGAPPIVNLLDMFAWLSRTTGKLNPKVFIDWLEGRLTFENYLIQDPTLYANIYNPASYNHGIGLEKLWAMFTNATFNMTGFYNWFKNVKGANPYKLMYELNIWNDPTHSQSPDPLDIFFYIQNPNFVIYPDGGVGFIFHDAMGGSGTNHIISKNNFWNLFNGSWWKDHGGIESYWDISVPSNTLAGLLFGRIRELEQQQIIDGKVRAELTFNLFQMLINLNVLPEDWITQIELQGVLPLQLLAVYDVLNFTKLLKSAAELERRMKMKINGTFRIQFNGMDLFDPIHTLNYFNYVISPSDMTALYHFLNFIDPTAYTSVDGSFAIY